MKILVGGDLYLGDKNSVARKDSFDLLKHIRENYDLFFCNLEGLISDRFENDTSYGIKLINSTKSVDILKHIGIDGVFLSNNHTTDFDVVDETLDILDKNDIFSFGLGYEKDLFKIIKTDNEELLVCSMSEDIGEKEDFATKIKKSYIHFNETNLKKLSEQNIINKLLYIHHGLMREYYPTPNVRDLLLKYAHGFSLMVGSHAHHIMGIEKYKDKILAYGLGDLYFHTFVDKKNRFIYKNFKKSNFSFLLGIELKDGNIQNHKIYPLELKEDKIIYNKKSLKKIKKLSDFENFNFEKLHTRDNGLLKFIEYELQALNEYIYNVVRYNFRYEFLKSPGFRKIEVLNKLIAKIRKWKYE